MKSALIANMNHEIRTPLNAIVGFASLLSIIDDEKEQQEYIGLIQSNTEHLLRLMNDVIDLSNIESGVMDIVGSDVVLDSLMKEMELTYVPKAETDNLVLAWDRLSYSRISTPAELWRREAESNCRERICNPVHNHFAIAPPRFLSITEESWSGRRVSNSRPQPWQGCALPTELLPHRNTNSTDKKPFVKASSPKIFSLYWFFVTIPPLTD